MAKLPIRWIQARTYSHATEDEGRVAQALETACPGGEAGREVLEGHFGNPLVRLTRRVTDGHGLAAVWDRWMEAGLLASVGRDVDARVDDEGILHFRVDKQRAFEGILDVARDADPIDVRVKLMAFPAKPEQVRKVARALVVGGP